MSVARIVPNDEVAHIRGTVGPMLDKAINHADGNLLLIDVLYRILAGEQQLWIAEDGAQIIACAVTQVLVFPRKKVLSIAFIAGSDMNAWIGHEPVVEEYARQRGCVAFEGYARQGWARRAPAGWYPVYTAIRRDL